MRVWRRTARPAAWIGAAFLALVGCSSEPTGTTPDQLMTQIAREIGPSRGGSGSGVRDISELNRAAISGVTEPLALVTIPDVSVATTVTRYAQKGMVDTWRSADGGAILLDGPVLFATRGIGNDLLAAETAGVRALLAAGRSGVVSRDFRHLDGLDQIRIWRYQCDLTREASERIVVLEVTHAVTRYRERCSGDGPAFENLYWLDSGGFAWKSKQWVGPVPGAMTIERLVR